MDLTKLRRVALAPLLLAAVTASAAFADEPMRLVEVLPARGFTRGTHVLNVTVPAAATGQWFVTASGDGPGTVEVDGRVVVQPVDLVGPRRDRATKETTLRPTSTIRVRVPGNHRLTVRVFGVARAADLPAGLGKKVGRVTVFEHAFQAGVPPRHTRLTVNAPGSDGVLFLTAERSGPRPILIGRVHWNDEAVLGVLPIHEQCPTVTRPVVASAMNTLDTWVLGVPGAVMTVRLEGWLVDEGLPTANWASPAEGAALGAGGALRLTYSDAGTGVAPSGVRIRLNTTDVTSAFAIGAAEATATFEALPASALIAGTNTLRATVTDRAGNAVEAVRHFVAGAADTTAPTLTQPPNLVVEQAGPLGTVVAYAAPTATDDRDPSPVVTCTPAPGTLFPAGVTTVVCTARDAAGNQAQVTFTVTVRDTAAPSLARPADLTVEQQGPAGSLVSYAAPAATDAVDPSPSVVCSPPSGALFPAGATTVTCTATDGAGNSAQVTFQVVVRDTTAPTLAQPADLTVEQEAPAGTVVAFAAPAATDAVDAAPQVVCVPAPGSLFAPGATTVTCTATDDAGNSSQVTFRVVVLDRTPPTLAPTADLTVEQQGPGGSTVTFAAPAATDAADPSVEVVCAPPSGSLFAPGATTVTCTATDDAGNSAQSTFLVTVVDTTPPAVTIVSPAVGTTAGASALLRITFADAVSSVDTSLVVMVQGRDVTASLTRSAGAAEAELGTLGLSEGEVFVEASAQDAAGNGGAATVTFTYVEPAVVTRLVVQILPAPLAPLLLGQRYDLTLKAVTSSGAVVPTFTGVVLVETTDATSPLNGLLVDFDASHAGVRTLPGLAEFRTAGSIRVDAQLIDDASIAGALTLEVVDDQPPVVGPDAGYVHGQAFHARTGAPLAAARVTAEGVGGVVFTDDAGRFAFPISNFPADRRKDAVLQIFKPGFLGVTRRVTVTTTRDVAVDPARLVPLDAATTPIGPDGGTARSADGGIVAVFPAGATTATLPIVMTTYQSAEELPGKLPESSFFTYCVELLPDGARFNQAVRVFVRNDLDFPVGTPVPVGYFDRRRGVWVEEGMGVVVADADVPEDLGFPTAVYFEAYHFTPYDLNFPATPPKNSAPPKVEQPLLPPETYEPEQETDDPGVGVKTGSLSLDLELPPVRFLGAWTTPRLVYHSNNAAPRALLGVDVAATPDGFVVPLHQRVTLSIEGTRHETYFRSGGAAARQALAFDVKNARGQRLPTGSYPYTLSSESAFQFVYELADRFGGPGVELLPIPARQNGYRTTTYGGRLVVNNQEASAFGAGWSLAGLNRLHFDPDGRIVLAGGGGSATVFTLTSLSIDKAEFFPIDDTPRSVAVDPSGEIVVAAAGQRPPFGGVGTPEFGVIRIASDGSSRSVAGDYRYNFLPGQVALDGMGRAYMPAAVADAYYNSLEPRVMIDDRRGSLDPYLYEVRGRGCALDQRTNLLYVSDGNPSAADGTIRICDSRESRVIATNLVLPSHLALDKQGRLYVACYDGTVRRFTVDDPDTYFNDTGGEVFAADLGNPFGLAFDDRGNLFVSSNGAIWRITPEGERTLFANGSLGAEAIACDDEGNLYVTGDFPGRGPGVLKFALAAFGATAMRYTPASTSLDRSTISFENSTRLYTRREPNGLREYYDERGLLAAVVDQNNNVTAYRYVDADGDGGVDDVSEITHPGAGTWRFTYDARGKVTAIDDPAGRRVLLTVDPAGDLVTFTDPAGGSVQMTYGSDHHMTRTRDPRGNDTTYEYDADGRCRVLELANGRRIEFTPSDSAGLANRLAEGVGTRTNPADPFPAGARDLVSAQGDLPGSMRTDGFGNVLEYDDAVGRKTKTTRDARGQPLTVTRPTGTQVALEYDPLGNVTQYVEGAESSTTTFSYDLEHDVLLEAHFPDGSSLTNELDARGNVVRQTNATGVVTEIEHDARGLPTRITVGKGTAVEATFVLTHDPVTGNLTSRTDPLGNTTTFTYDLAGNLLTRTDGEGFTRSYRWDGMGRVVESTSARSLTTHFGYDARGNMTSVTDPLNHTTYFAFDSVNQLTTVTDPLARVTRFTYTLRGDRASRTDPDGAVTTYTWDEASRLTAITDALTRTTTFEYGADEYVLAATRPDGTRVSFERDAWGHVTAATNARGHTTHFRYNAMGQLEEREDALGGLVKYEYNANGYLRRFTDELDHVTEWERDPLDRVVSIKDPSGAFHRTTRNLNGLPVTEVDRENRTTTYAYDRRDLLKETVDARSGRVRITRDPDGRIVGRTDARNNTTQEVFDAAGRWKETIYADGRRETAVRDAVGNITDSTDRAGRTTRYAYDLMNRPTRRTLPDGVVIEDVYDVLGRVTRSQGRGTLTWTYDVMGRVREATQATSVASGTTRYTYDADGNRASLVYPDGYTVLYERDELARLTAIVEAAGSGGRRLVDYGYDAASRRTSSATIDGSTVRSGHDVLGRLVSLQRELGGSTVDSVAFTYDRVGNVLSKTEPVGRTEYAYSMLDELTTVDDPLGQDESFVHDLVGNRTSSSSASGSLGYLAGVLNQYTEVSGVTAGYDTLGNQTTDGVRTFTYDVENQLTSAVKGTSTMTLSYDPAGRRASRTVTGPAGGTTGYLYDGQQVLCATNASGHVTTRFVYAGLDEPVVMLAGGRTYTYQWDGRGNVRSLTDESGQVVEQYRVSAFGKLLESRTGPGSALGAGVDLLGPASPTAGAPSAIGNPYFFHGRALDHEVGLYDFRNRAYDPLLGRFLQLDPLGVWGDPINRGGGYSFAGGNPLRWADPLGLGTTSPQNKEAGGIFSGLIDGFLEEGAQMREALGTLVKLVSGEIEMPTITPELMKETIIEFGKGLIESLADKIPIFVMGKMLYKIGKAIAESESARDLAKTVGKVLAGALIGIAGGAALAGPLKKLAAKLGIGSKGQNVQANAGGGGRFSSGGGAGVGSGGGAVGGGGGAPPPHLRTLADRDQPGRLYDVGRAHDLRATSMPGTEVHHVPQQRQGESLIGDWNKASEGGNEASIRLPKEEHDIISELQRSERPVPATARDLLARDLRDLRNNTNAPNSSLQELSRFAQDLHPSEYTKTPDLRD